MRSAFVVFLLVTCVSGCAHYKELAESPWMYHRNCRDSNCPHNLSGACGVKPTKKAFFGRKSKTVEDCECSTPVAVPATVPPGIQRCDAAPAVQPAPAGDPCSSISTPPAGCDVGLSGANTTCDTLATANSVGTSPACASSVPSSGACDTQPSCDAKGAVHLPTQGAQQPAPMPIYAEQPVVVEPLLTYPVYVPYERTSEIYVQPEQQPSPPVGYPTAGESMDSFLPSQEVYGI